MLFYMEQREGSFRNPIYREAYEPERGFEKQARLNSEPCITRISQIVICLTKATIAHLVQ